MCVPDWLEIHEALEPLLLEQKAKRLEQDAISHDRQLRTQIWEYAQEDAANLDDPYDYLLRAFGADIPDYPILKRFHGLGAPILTREELERMRPEIQAESDSRQEKFLRTLHDLLDSNKMGVCCPQFPFCSVRSPFEPRQHKVKSRVFR